MTSFFNFIFSRNTPMNDSDDSEISDSGYDSTTSNINTKRIIKKVNPMAFSTRKSARKVSSRKMGTKTKDRVSTEEDYYDPRKSTADNNTIEEFIKAPLSRSLESIPGVGPGNAGIFYEEGIHTPVQLLAVYLVISGLTEDPIDLSDRFYFWLQSIGINSHRNTIVEVISRKSNAWIPGIYDGKAY